MGKSKNIDTKLIWDFIDTITKEYSSEYRFDYFIPAFKPVGGVNLSQLEKYLDNTIAAYRQHHPEFSITDASRAYLLELFEEPKATKKFVSFDNRIILRELYKILWFIDMTQQSLEFISDSSVYPGTYFAKIQSDLKKVKSFRMHHYKNIVGVTRLADPSESRLRYWLATRYGKNRCLTNFFLHLLLLADLEKITILADDEKSKSLIENVLEFFLIQHTIPNDVIKSLGILLYHEIFKFLNLTHTKSGAHTQNIIYELFETDINMYEFQRNVFIKSSIGFWPIFGASKKSHPKEEDQNYIRQTLLKEMRPVAIDAEVFETIFQHLIKKPHIQFLQKYPGEFFRQNPKYSR